MEVLLIIQLIIVKHSRRIEQNTSPDISTNLKLSYHVGTYEWMPEWINEWMNNLISPV